MVISRCHWAATNPLLLSYHDQEWGVPVHDDRKLFEMLNLESAQAGLSWLTILKRRENYRRAFANFDAEAVAQFDDAKQATLLQDAGIIRNRLKIAAVVANARALPAVRQTHGTLNAYLWGYTDGRRFTAADHDEAVAVSERLSAGLKRDGFRFVGPTTCYAFMQAVGMINDHEPGCFRYAQIKAPPSKP